MNQKAELKGKLEGFERNRKNRFELLDGGEIVGGGVQKPVEFIGRFQFRPVQHTRVPARIFAKRKLAVPFGQSSNLFRRKSSHLGYPHTLPHMGRGIHSLIAFGHNGILLFCLCPTPPTSVCFLRLARQRTDCRARRKHTSSLTRTRVNRGRVFTGKRHIVFYEFGRVERVGGGSETRSLAQRRVVSE